MSLDVHGQALAELIGSWGPDAPHVITHDYGGAVALRAHLLEQVAFASLALVDATQA